MENTKGKIKDHTDELEKIYKQRRHWLYASSIVYTVIIFLIFGGKYIDKHFDNTIWWVIASLGLLISVNWWYWTMTSITTLIRTIYSEYEILREVSTDIEELRILIKNKSNDDNC